MRIQYRQDSVPLDMRSKFVADLIGYKLQRDLKANEKLRALSDDKNYLTRIVNVAKKSQTTTGMTIDTVLNGVKTAMGMEIFSFKINGINPFQAIADQLKGEEFTVEVYMNPLYFSAEVALSQVMPGFRKKQLDEQAIQDKMLKTSRAWSFQFEKNIKEYIDIQKCQKKILEEV